MKIDSDTEKRILAHIDSEWQSFLELYKGLSPRPNSATIAALKAGFYSGFKAGAVAMHDANKIL